MASAAGAFLIARPSFLFGIDDFGGGGSGEGEEGTDTPHAPTFQAQSLGYVTAAVGACCGAAVFVLIRRSGKLGAHTLQLMMSWAVFGMFFGLLFGLVLCGPGRPLGNVDGGPWIVPPDAYAWGSILGACVFGSAANALLNYAGRIAPAGLSSIVKSSEMVWSYLLQAWLFDAVPTAQTLVGVVLICGGLVVIAIQRRVDERGVAARVMTIAPHGPTATPVAPSWNLESVRGGWSDEDAGQEEEEDADAELTIRRKSYGTMNAEYSASSLMALIG